MREDLTNESSKIYLEELHVIYQKMLDMSYRYAAYRLTGGRIECGKQLQGVLRGLRYNIKFNDRPSSAVEGSMQAFNH